MICSWLVLYLYGQVNYQMMFDIFNALLNPVNIYTSFDDWE